MVAGRAEGSQHSCHTFPSFQGKAIPPVRLGVAVPELPRQGGDGVLCKALNKVPLSPRLTRSSLAPCPALSQRRDPESQLYARAGDQRDTGALLEGPDKGCPGGTERQSPAGSRGHKGPAEEAALGAQRPSGHSITAGSDARGGPGGVLLLCAPGEGPGGVAGKGQVGFVGRR